MKTNKIPPAFIRYLKPRLQPFSKPLFWGSLSIFSVLGVVIYQYGRYSDWLEASSEITTKNLPNQGYRSHLTREDLAIGADIDNLDLLLQEVNQNQNFSLDLSSNFQKNSVRQNSQDESLNRFQAKPQTKSDRSSPVSNSQNNLTDKNFLGSLDNKNYPLTSPLDNRMNSQSVSPSSNLITNPVGRLYLSNRQQVFNTNQSLLTENNLVHSDNLPTNNTGVNSVPVETSPLTTNNSFQGAANEPKTQIDNTSTTPLINSSQFINNYQFELKEKINNLQQINLSSSQQNNYLNPINNSNSSEINSNTSELQPNNLTNYQKQPLNFYQLNPSNYQLQPQGLEPIKRETLSSPSNNSVSKEIFNQTNQIDFNNSIFNSNNLLPTNF